MSLIEDALAIWRAGPPLYGEWQCLVCNRDGRDQLLHEDGCAWLSMPRIVAALEAAHRVIGMNVTATVVEGNGIRVCLACRYNSRVPNSHFDDCPWQALVAALQ